MAGTGLTEGRVPEWEEWSGAAALILGMRVVGKVPGVGRDAVQVFNKAFPDLVPKLRAIYKETGIAPLDVAEVAKSDPSVVGDLLGDTAKVPERFASDMLDRVKAGEKVPVEAQEKRGAEPSAFTPENETGMNSLADGSAKTEQ